MGLCHPILQLKGRFSKGTEGAWCLRWLYFHGDIGMDVGAVGVLCEVRVGGDFPGGLVKDCALEDIYGNMNTVRSVLGYAGYSIGCVLSDLDLGSSVLRTRRVKMGKRAHDV